jgi:hypothetical protein
MGAKDISKTMTLKDMVTGTLKKMSGGTVEYKKNLRDLKQVGSTAFKGIAIGAAATGVAVLAAGAGFLNLAKRTSDYASGIDDASQRTGVAAEEFQKYAYAAKLSGIETEGMEKAMIKQQKAFSDAREGSKTAAAAYTRLGININDIGSSGDAFDAVIASLADMKDETIRNALANDIFGKSYADLGPLLNEGSAGINKLKQEAVDLGTVMSEGAVKAGARFGDTLDSLKMGIKGMFQSMGSPALNTFSNGMQWLIDKIPSVKKVAQDTFDSIKQAIQDNADKFNSIKSVFADIKLGIVGAFGSDGEGGGAINWMINTGIPGVVGGVASILEGATNTYNYIKDNWSLIAPIIYIAVGALGAYKFATYAATVATLLFGQGSTFAAIKTVVMGTASLVAAGQLSVMGGAQLMLNAAMSANPIGLIVLGIAALIAVGVLLVRNWDNVKLAGQMVWNGIVSGVEWGVNAYISYLNILIDGALGGLNFLIRSANAITGSDIGEVSFGIKKVDFSAAKFDTEDQEFDWRMGKKKEDSPDDVIAQMNAEQKKADSKQKQQTESQSNLSASLDANTAATKDNTKTVKATLRDKSSIDIADSLFARIERHSYGT